MGKAVYQKPFRTVAEQVALLEGRGLMMDVDPAEIASFGALVHFFRMMCETDQNRVATAYGMKGNYAASYIQLTKLMDETPTNPVFDARARAAIPSDPFNSPYWV